MSVSKILYKGIVVDNQDTYMLNRIRVMPKKKDDNERILKSRFADEKLIQTEYGLDLRYEFRYSNEDPFVFYPLLSFSLSIVPQPGEFVWFLYSDPTTEGGGKVEQFYLPSVKSNPFNVVREDYEQANKTTSEGGNLKKSRTFRSPTPNSDGIKEITPPTISGIFANPGDNALYGQGTTDVILKPYEVLIRAGKVDEFKPNTIVNPNDKRAFLQMSYFKTQKNINNPQTVDSNEVDKSPLKKLIEYTITNPENNFNTFTGFIFIYDLPSSKPYPNDTFTNTTPVDNSISTPFWQYEFKNLSIENVGILISDVINQLANKGEIEIADASNPKPKQIFQKDRLFPLYYRPNSSITNILKQTPDFSSDSTILTKITNMSNLVSRVKYQGAYGDIDGGGLITSLYGQSPVFGVSVSSVKKTVDDSEFESKANSASLLVSSNIFLLTYGTKVNDKFITMGRDTIYGLGQSFIESEVLPNTDSMVRGEKLKQILNLMVKFLTTHCHPFHGLPPVPTSFSGVDVTQIEAEFQLYDSKVLNQKIRIN